MSAHLFSTAAQGATKRAADCSPRALHDKLKSELWRMWVPSDESSLLTAQQDLLEHFIDGREVLHSKRSEIPFRDGVEVMNCVDSWSEEEVLQRQDEDHEAVVLAHGFGMGLGIFMRNYADFLQRYDRVLGVDWLGMGGSSRPSNVAPLLPVAPSTLSGGTSGLDPDAASAFFVDSLESWRQNMKLKKMHLVGHSLGGYLSARYAMKYPERIASLTLASPAGLLPIPSTTHDMASAPLLLRVLERAWQNNVTPQQIVRLLGPRGKPVVERLLGRRLSRSRGAPGTDLEKALLNAYVYHVSANKPSGEYAMNSLLTPLMIDSSDGLGATGRRIKLFARQPLYEDFAEALRGSGVRVGVLFGDRDWLADPLVADVADYWSQCGIDVSLRTVRDAGHHLYLDSPEGFLEHVLNVTSSRSCT